MVLYILIRLWGLVACQDSSSLIHLSIYPSLGAYPELVHGGVGRRLQAMGHAELLR